MLVQKELKNAYIGIPSPTSIVLDKSSISLTTVGQTEQLTATIEPTVSDKTITWTTSDSTVATVSTTGLVTCVTPGECTITATTVNGLTASCSVAGGRLPSAYQEVEWIESSGTQWIDTGVKPTSDTVNQLKVMFLAWTGDCVYGYCRNDNTANYRLFNAYANAGGTTYNEGQFVFDTTHNNSYARVTTGTGHSSLNTIYELELGDFYIKDLSTGTNIVTGTAGTVTNIGNYTITLNNYRNTRYSQNRWYYVKIYESGTLIRDIVPCYRIADGVIGMYDLVNDVFYTNSGTGTFTKGPDVN